jgi:hypothetical protein
MNAENRLDARLRSALEQQSVGVGEIDTPSALLEALDRSARRTRRTRIGYAVAGALAAAAAAVVVAVIGPNGPPRQLEPVSPTPPTGTWQRTLTETGQWSGRWSITFSAGNVLVLTAPAGLSPDEGAVDGASYAVRDDTLRLDAFSNGACLDQPAGAYRWTVDGDRLFLEAADDPCQERRHVFAGVWRQGP